MSVLIRDMEMPENCDECPIKACEDEWYVCPFSGVPALSIGRQDSCPLMEIPPHGRLIDADDAEEILMNDPTCITVFDAIKRLKEMPVIMPANKEKQL